MFPFLLFCSLFYLKDPLEDAQEGDYVLYELEKQAFLIHLVEKNPDSIVLGELHTPSRQIKKHLHNLQNWSQNGAPGKTSWTLWEISRKNWKTIDSYSLSKGRYLKENLSSPLLLLLTIPVSPDKEELLKSEGSSNWKSDIFFETPYFERATVEYIRNKERIFPVAILLKTTHKSLKMKQIDEGKGFISLSFPTRVPTILQLEQKNQLLSVSIYCREPYLPFDLYLENTSSGDSLLLCQKKVKKKGDVYTVLLDKEEVDQWVKPGFSYKLKGQTHGLLQTSFSFDFRTNLS